MPSYYFYLLCGCLITLGYTPIISAQIIPDNSLGVENSVVKPNSNLKNTFADLIEGGAIRGNNLFHSFAEFNVFEGNNVYFANPAGITNILTRVTGNNASQILGKLGVDGAANLFLLNPHGILFGNNAALDINGSFLATTADSYLFNNGFTYSAVNPETPPLLTINIPLGLQLGTNPGKIINQSRFTANEAQIQGLTIPNEQTLSLIGGEVLLEGGYLSTSKGNIEIGAVAPNNQVNLVPTNQGWQANYQDVKAFADLTINQDGGIDGGNLGGSTITLTGKNISLGQDLKTINQIDYTVADFFTLQPLVNLDKLPVNTATIIANNQNNHLASQIQVTASDTFSLINGGNILANTDGKGDAGNIAVDANSVIIYGVDLSSLSNEKSEGNAGNIQIKAQNMSVQNGGAGVNTSGTGNGGVIDLKIVHDLKIQSGGFGADTFATGNGGTIRINANNLEIVSGGAGVNTLGSGNGGTIELKIANNLNIELGGFGADTVSTGNGGAINIEAKHIQINSGGLGVNTRNLGKAGELSINADTIILNNGLIGAESGSSLDERDVDSNQLQEKYGTKNAGNGGTISVIANVLALNNSAISTATSGRGNAGNIELKVNSLELTGNETTFIRSSTNGSGNGGNIEILAKNINLSGNSIINARSEALGNAGNIFIQTDNFIQLKEQASISVDGGIKGGSGNIEIDSKQINLQEYSKISAQVNNGSEGNIVIRGNNLSLKDSSQITTNATQNAVGGSIFIDLQESLLAKDHSQIIANSIKGQGGNINITARGIFTLPNSIDASSQFGIDGNINLNNLSVDLNSGLITLPKNPHNSQLSLAKGCEYTNSRFVYIGRGALPENLLEPHLNEGLIPDFGEQTTVEDFASPVDFVNSHSSFEANSWQINTQGDLELVVANNQAQLPITNNLNCSGKTNYPIYQ